jgi:hypothetical protein
MRKGIRGKSAASDAEQRKEVAQMRRTSILTALGVLCLAAAAAPETAAASTVKAVEYPIAISTGSILDMTAGPDGAVWFT